MLLSETFTLHPRSCVIPNSTFEDLVAASVSRVKKNFFIHQQNEKNSISMQQKTFIRFIRRLGLVERLRQVTGLIERVHKRRGIVIC